MKSINLAPDLVFGIWAHRRIDGHDQPGTLNSAAADAPSDIPMQLKNTIKNFGEASYASVRAIAYDSVHRKEATMALATLEEHTGRKLSAHQRKQADEYAADVFGSRRFAPWLYVYTMVNGGFKEGWIPDNFFGRVVVPQINKGLGHMASLKSFTNVVLQTDALPDMAYLIDGVTYDRNRSVISIDELRELVRGRGNGAFFKADASSRGRGVFRVTAEEINESMLRETGNGVFQQLIRPHPALDRMIAGPVATIRITTAKDAAGAISRRAAYLRLGRSNTSWVQSDNSVRVAIVDADGGLGSLGYTQDWRPWREHPDTGFTFENQLVPNFADAAQLCVDLHKRLPHLSVIGWDMTIADDEQVKIIEWNCIHGDIKFSEATTGPCFLGLNWERLRP